MGKFVIAKRKNGEFQFTLQANNGEVILVSEGYKTKTSCKAGIKSVQTNAPLDARFERKVAKNGKTMFNLRARNAKVIGTSEQYETEKARENGISSVMKNAPDAKIVDNTVAA
jgi:hypothetical protein